MRHELCTYAHFYNALPIIEHPSKIMLRITQNSKWTMNIIYRSEISEVLVLEKCLRNV